MLHAPQGLHAFFRAYYHCKSADWPGNKPHPLKARTAAELAQVPTYYVMEKDKGMAATVAPMMPSPAEIAACKWLTEAEVAVYATEYARTQFTGALQGYRVRRGTDPRSIAEMHTFSGRTIDVPSLFIAGTSDWGMYQTPGAIERMQGTSCTRLHRRAPRRRRRPLGAAGAAREGVRAAAGLFARPGAREMSTAPALPLPPSPGREGRGEAAIRELFTRGGTRSLRPSAARTPQERERERGHRARSTAQLQFAFVFSAATDCAASARSLP